MIKVKKYFIDRDTGATYQPGDVYEGTAERVDALRTSGHLNKTEAEPEAEKPAKK